MLSHKKNLPVAFVIERYQQLESTNTFARTKVQQVLASTLSAKERANALDGHVILAQTQTKGRGTRDHIWISDKGNMFLSLILPLTELGLNPSLCSETLSLKTGEGVARMVRQFCPHANVTIKWPNDVLVDGLKISGILIEIEPPYAIIGIGINLISAPQIPGGATFLNRYTPVTFDEALWALLDSLKKTYFDPNFIYRLHPPKTLINRTDAPSESLEKEDP